MMKAEGASILISRPLLDSTFLETFGLPSQKKKPTKNPQAIKIITGFVFCKFSTLGLEYLQY